MKIVEGRGRGGGGVGWGGLPLKRGELNTRKGDRFVLL